VGRIFPRHDHRGRPFNGIVRAHSVVEHIMPKWLRVILAIVAGFVVWFAVATLGNFAIRWLYPGYSEVERAMNFSLGMLFARLVLGAVASLVSGAACIAVAGGSRAPIYSFATLLLALFVPVHVGLWVKFPVWYHILFLGSLVALVLVGARLRGLGGSSAA
jgi:hypothetical protein